jgi:5-methylcytosine-specific restriction protein A
MAQRSKKICALGGCQNRTMTRWCDEHTKTTSVARSYDLRRGNSTQRGYDASWVKLRLVALRRDQYLCQECLRNGRPTQARDVDHVIPIAVAPERRLDLTNLESLCSTCHKIKTFKEDGCFGRQKKIRTA